MPFRADFAENVMAWSKIKALSGDSVREDKVEDGRKSATTRHLSGIVAEVTARSNTRCAVVLRDFVGTSATPREETSAGQDGGSEQSICAGFWHCHRSCIE